MWTPFSIDWICLPDQVVQGESLCSLEAIGYDLPASSPLASVSSPTTSTGYEVRRGSTFGEGITLVRSIATLDCVRNAPFMFCRSRNPEVRLSAGLYQAFNFGAPSKSLYIYSLQAGHSFDADGNPGVPQVSDALLVARYLLGFRGTALVQGITLGAGKTPASVAAHIQDGLDNGWFDFLEERPPTGLREMQMLTRCLQGMSGSRLIAGIAEATVPYAQRKCDELKLAF